MFTTKKLILAILLAVTSVLVPTTSAHAETSRSSEEVQFVTLINELRADLGVAPLALNPELYRGVDAWTAQMAQADELNHSPNVLQGITSDWAKIGENVGVAPQGQIQALFDAFVASPSHYKNLINPAFHHIGVSVINSDGRVWTTHRFMRLKTDTDSETDISAASINDLTHAASFASDDADVLRLYGAAFGREPDLEGAIYWLNLRRRGLSPLTIANHLTVSQEWLNLYEGKSDLAYVTAVYANVLDRTVDTEGLNYWVAQLASNGGSVSRGELVYWVSQSIEHRTANTFGGI